MERFCRDLPSGRGLPLAWSPPGLAVTKNFLSTDQCDELVNFLSKQPTADALVDLVTQKSGEIDQRVDRQRITKAIELGEKQETVIKYVVMAFRDVAVPYFEASLHTFETPSALKTFQAEGLIFTQTVSSGRIASRGGCARRTETSACYCT